MIIIKSIEVKDNAQIAQIIRNALTEFGANKPGTVFFDPTTDDLFALFQKERAHYFIAEEEGEILGGGGIYPTQGLDADTCELVKMYLKPDARGKRLGKMLIEKSIEKAIDFGYKNIYLESMPELKNALKIYEKFGFTYLCNPMGNSGHTGCDLWMMKEL